MIDIKALRSFLTDRTLIKISPTEICSYMRAGAVGVLLCIFKDHPINSVLNAGQRDQMSREERSTFCFPPQTPKFHHPVESEDLPPESDLPPGADLPATAYPHRCLSTEQALMDFL